MNRTDMDLLSEATSKIILKEYDIGNEFQKVADRAPNNEDHMEDMVNTKLHAAIRAIESKDLEQARAMIQIALDEIEEYESGAFEEESDDDLVPLEQAFSPKAMGAEEDSEEDISGFIQHAQEINTRKKRAGNPPTRFFIFNGGNRQLFRSFRDKEKLQEHLTDYHTVEYEEPIVIDLQSQTKVDTGGYTGGVNQDMINANPDM